MVGKAPKKGILRRRRSLPLPGAGGNVTFLRFVDGTSPEAKPSSYESKQETPQNSPGLPSPVRGSPTINSSPSLFLSRRVLTYRFLFHSTTSIPIPRAYSFRIRFRKPT